MVFHTAPPQPASKARMICSPQLVGGAEASQKGLGELMPPANPWTRMSGTGNLREVEHGECGALAVGHGIHNFASAVDAVAASEVAGMAGLSGGAIGDDAAVPHFDVSELLHELCERRLADGGYDHVEGDGGLRFGDGRESVSGLLDLNGIEQKEAVGADANGDGSSAPEELHAFLPGVLVLKAKGGDVALAAAIEHIYSVGAETTRGVGGINGGV